MPINILMPALSPTMEEGKLAKWLVREGDAIRSGDVLAEIETDKATMEVEAIDDGTVGKLLVAEGTEGVAVNALIAVLLEEGEDAAALDAAIAGQGAATPAGDAAVLEPAALSATAVHPPEEPAPPPEPAARDGHVQQDGRAQQNGRVFASPLARRIANETSIDLAGLSGSGPHGRIVKADVEAAMAAGAGSLTSGQARAAGTALSTASAPATALQPGGQQRAAIPSGMTDQQIMALYEEGSFDIVPHDGMRKIIAARLTQSKQTIPHFYLNADCRLDELLAARKRLNDRAPKEGPRAFKLSVNDFIIKAMALALQDVPSANTTWTEQGTLQHKSSDIGVAVAVDGGLFTPVIRHGELKSLSEISNEMKDLAMRARSKRLAPHEYQGGTTSISNLGMYGVKSFDAVINPPHATILAVGAGAPQAIVVDGRLEAATIMSVTLSCDHRVVDGAIGAELLAAFKGFIEDPLCMLV